MPQNDCLQGATGTSSLAPHMPLQVAASATGQSNHASKGIANRREAVQLALIGLLAQQYLPALAAERRGMNRYIKKKALDPLET